MTPSLVSTLATIFKPYVKSKWEKELDNWIRGNRDKTQFPILNDNNKYITWNEQFIPKCNVQKLSNMINADYILDYTDPSEEELYNEKCIYLWSVLLRSLHNLYGLDCMSERMEDHDARSAYFNHQKKHKRSVI